MSTNTTPNYPLTLPLEHHVEGDTWDGFYELSVEVDGVPPTSPLVLVEMVLAKADARAGGPVVLSTAVPTQVLITSAAGWQARVLPQPLPGVTAGRWLYQIRFTDADGVRKTYYQGDLLVAKTLSNS